LEIYLYFIRRPRDENNRWSNKNNKNTSCIEVFCCFLSGEREKKLCVSSSFLSRRVPPKHIYTSNEMFIWILELFSFVWRWDESLVPLLTASCCCCCYVLLSCFWKHYCFGLLFMHTFLFCFPFKLPFGGKHAFLPLSLPEKFSIILSSIFSFLSSSVLMILCWFF
jgi:predicted AlkP superfamily pyrophosphatase or phosphodiesterase